MSGLDMKCPDCGSTEIQVRSIDGVQDAKCMDCGAVVGVAQATAIRRRKIPIAEGKRLCEKYNAPIVIVFSLLDKGDTVNVMTYGATKALCRVAADLGKQITDKVMSLEISPSRTEPTELPNVPTEWDSTP